MIELNKIYAEDCLLTMARMEDKSVDLFLTDIPYNEVNRESNGLRNLDKKDADILTFDLLKFLQEADRIAINNIVVWCGRKQLSTIYSFYEYNKRLGVWIKDNPSPMNGEFNYLNGTEECVIIKKPHGTFNAFCKKAVYAYPVEQGQIHPTQKPLELFWEQILDLSNEGDIIYDACMGSGTTALACIKTNRNFIGSEISQTYVDLANKRIDQHLRQEKLEL